MAARDRSDIATSLLRKGFVLSGRKRDHDFYIFEHQVGQTIPVYTKLSRGSGYKSYGSSLLGLMAKQLNLTTAELLDLIDCPLTRERYLAILKERKVISE